MVPRTEIVAAMIGARAADLARAFQNLGFSHAIRLKGLQLLHRLRPPRKPFILTSKASAFPLCRPATSDSTVFWQVFIAREYDGVNPADTPRFIIDCGANVGYTAAYLLTRSLKQNL